MLFSATYQYNGIKQKHGVFQEFSTTFQPHSEKKYLIGITAYIIMFSMFQAYRMHVAF